MRAEDTIRTLQRHLRALLRAELLIAEIKLGALLKKTTLMALAGVIAVFGLATLNFAAYHALAPLWGEVWALVAVAIGNFAIAGILVLIASRPNEAPTLPLATELRDQAITALELDARLAVDKATGFVRRPLQTVGSALAIIVGLLRHRNRND